MGKDTQARVKQSRPGTATSIQSTMRVYELVGEAIVSASDVDGIPFILFNILFPLLHVTIMLY